MNNELKAKQEIISAETIEVAKAIVQSANAFMNEFPKSDIFSFSNSRRTEDYSEKYFSFISSIFPLLSRLNELNADMASLLIKSDKKMEIDIIVLCEKRFNAFEAFEKSLYEYTSAMESELSKPSASVIFILNSTQKFKEALNQLITSNL